MAKKRRQRGRRNPMPGFGALYIVNGRKRRKKKAHRRRARRRNGIALRTNRGRRARRKGSKSRKSRKSRKGRRRSRRRNGLALRMNRRRRNGLALRTNRRRRNRSRKYAGLRARARLTGRWASAEYRKRHNRRRRNGYVIFRNSKKHRKSRRRRNTGVSGLFGKVGSMVGKFPVLGPIVGKYVGPALMGAVGVAGVYLASQYIIGPYVMPWIPPQIMAWIAPAGLTISAIALGALLAKLPLPMLSGSTKAALISGAVVAAAGVDTIRALSGMDSGSAVSDGGFTKLAGGSEEVSLYGDALPADALACGDDLDQLEGQAALSGPRAWAAAFPPATRRKRVVSADMPTSQHAGIHGHRWGWLVRMIGWKRFRQVAAMPKYARVAYLRQLRQQAIALVPQSGEYVDGMAGLGSLLFAGS